MLAAEQNHAAPCASCEARNMLVDVLSQLPPVSVFPALHVGESALPFWPARIVAGAELWDVHCNAVASDRT